MVTVSVKLRNGLIFRDIKTFYALDKVKPSFKRAYRERIRGRGQVCHPKWASLSFFSGQTRSEGSSGGWFTTPRLNEISESLLTYIYVGFLSCQNLPKFCAVFNQYSTCVVVLTLQWCSQIWSGSQYLLQNLLFFLTGQVIQTKVA